jgi:hypothetical protein
MSYSIKETARLESFESVSYEQAVDLGVELSKSTKSIITKVQSLKIPYIKKVVPAPKPVQSTKAELVASIQSFTTPFDLSGLTGATRDSLVGLEAFLKL